MTDQTAAKPQDEKTIGGGAMQIAVDLGPVALFMITYNVANNRAPDGQAIFWATGVFMAATFAALLYAWIVQKRVPPMLIVSAVIVGVFGGLTLALHDALFIKLKPTIINGLYAAIIFGGLAVKLNVWKLLFQGAFTLPDKVWNILAIRWGLFFIFLAALNEIVWRNTSEQFWANFKFFGVMPLTFAFLLANLPLTMKYMGKSETGENSPDART